MLAFKKNTTLFNVRHRKTCIILSDFIEFDLSQRTKLKGLMERGSTSIFQRSRSIEKNNIVFVLFTNCTILKKAKKSPFLALTLFDHVPKRKSGICYSLLQWGSVEVDVPTFGTFLVHKCGTNKQS